MKIVLNYLLILSVFSVSACKKESLSPPEPENYGTCVDQSKIDTILALSDQQLLEASVQASVLGPINPSPNRPGYCYIYTFKPGWTPPYEHHVMVQGYSHSVSPDIQTAINSLRDRIRRCGCGL